MFAFVPTVLPRATAFAGRAVTARAAAPAARWAMKKSASIPFLDCPPALENADIPGNANFDPLGFTNLFSLLFLQEAEIRHSRVCMLAVVGLIAQELYHFPWYADAPSMATAAHDWGVAKGPLVQLLLWISGLEIIVGVPALVQMLQGSPRRPGEFAWDPLGLGKNPATYKRYQASELRNGRLAMLAVGGLLTQGVLVNATPIQQLTSGKILPF